MANTIDPADFKIEEFLPYLLYRASTAIDEALADTLRENDVELGAWRVLAALRVVDGRRIGNLSHVIRIEISTLSRLIDRMAAAELVERRREQRDHRGVRVFITHKGETLAGVLIARATAITTTALSGLDPSERQALTDLLQRVVRNTAALAPAPSTAPTRRSSH